MVGILNSPVIDYEVLEATLASCGPNILLKNGDTVLIRLCGRKEDEGLIDAVCAILAAGANPIAQNNLGRTALMTAAAVGNEDLLQIVCNAQRMEDE